MSNKIRKFFGLFNFKGSPGLAQIPLMIGLLLMAVVVPLVTKLVQQNQENRGRATGTLHTLNQLSTSVPSSKVPTAVVVHKPVGCITMMNGVCVAWEVTTPVPTLAGIICPPGSYLASGKCYAIGTGAYVTPGQIALGPETIGGIIPSPGYCAAGDMATVCHCSNGSEGRTYRNSDCTKTCNGCVGMKPTATPKPIQPTAEVIPPGCVCTGGENSVYRGPASICIKAGQKCANNAPTVNPYPKITAAPTGNQCNDSGKVCTGGGLCVGGFCIVTTPIPIPTVGNPASCGIFGGGENGCGCIFDYQCASNNCLNARCLPKQPSGNLCTGNEGCESGRCILYRCVDRGVSCGTTGGWGSDCPCAVDGNCASGNCINSKCKPKAANGGYCTGGEGCITGKCVSGICVESTIIPTPTAGSTACGILGGGGNGCGCILDVQCATNNCVNAKCMPKQASGTVCTGDEGCLSGRCVLGRCVDAGVTCGSTSGSGTDCACVVDGSCASNNCVNGKCVPKQSNGGTCTGGEGCISGICLGGKCLESTILPTPTSSTARQCGVFGGGGDGCGCILDGQCSSGNCIGAVCTPPKKAGGSCTGHEGCESGVCNLITRVCLEPGQTCGSTRGQGNNCPCLLDSACASGNCINGGCISKQGNGGTCTGSEGCISAKCVSGKCVTSTGPTPTINANTSCGIIGGGGNGCGCILDVQCVTNNCVGAKCAPKQGVGAFCTGEEGCESGNCNLITRKCLEIGQTCGSTSGQGSNCPCLIDSACSSGNCINEKCIPKQPNGGTCTGSEGCISGLCPNGKCLESISPIPTINGNIACGIIGGGGNGCGCLFDVQCATNNCVSAKCAPKQGVGAFCTGEEGCESGVCNLVTRKCLEPGQTCGSSSGQGNNCPCLIDSACSSGNCINEKCIPKQPNGGTCTGSEGCVSGKCISGKCVESIALPTPTPVGARTCGLITGINPDGCGCIIDAQCASNNCYNAKCMPKQGTGIFCTGNEGCISGRCILGRCVDKGVTCGSTGGWGTDCPCIVDGNCASGNCVSGKCTPKKPNDGTCTGGEGCISGKCLGGKCIGELGPTPGGVCPVPTIGGRCVDNCVCGPNGLYAGPQSVCSKAGTKCPPNAPTVNPYPNFTPIPTAYNPTNCSCVNGYWVGDCTLAYVETHNCPGGNITGTPPPLNCNCLNGEWVGGGCTLNWVTSHVCPKISIPPVNPTTKPPINPTTPPSGGCKGSKPADVCTSSRLKIDAKCVNNSWDYNEQLCNKAGRTEVCSGKSYCCPKASGSWTTNMAACNALSKCTECPKDFKCYTDGSEYRWFVTGYVMDGFVAATGTEVTNCGGVVKPTFLGKAKGDATCDGTINMDDYSLWYKEFQDGDGTLVKKDWHADFTGPDGMCDGKVNMDDYSLWYKYFNDLNGNN
jgi:hypothetical protein